MSRRTVFGGATLAAAAAVCLLACGDETTPSESGPATAGEGADASATSAQDFRRSAVRDLDALDARLGQRREDLGELGSEALDRWERRIRELREELAREETRAPEERRRYEERIEEELAAIRRGLEELGGGPGGY